MPRPLLRIDRERLWANLMQLKEIGGYDAATGLRGVRRLALTDEDATFRPPRRSTWPSSSMASRREIAAICPTAMVFVAGEHGGISHTPREYSRPDACGNGIDVLANAVLALAEPDLTA